MKSRLRALVVATFGCVVLAGSLAQPTTTKINSTGLGAPAAFAGEAIADGLDVRDGEYSFAAALLMPQIIRPSDGKAYASACSGALIAPTWIITSGRCFHDGDRKRVDGPPRYRVLATVGSATRAGTGGTTAEVVQVVQKWDTDLAIARLDRPVPGVQPLRLNLNPPVVGDELRMVGWGATKGKAGLTDRPDRAQTGKVRVTAVERDTLRVRGFWPSNKTSACVYDLGAPLFTETSDGVFHLAATEIGGSECPHSQGELTSRIDTNAAWLISQIG